MAAHKPKLAGSTQLVKRNRCRIIIRSVAIIFVLNGIIKSLYILGKDDMAPAFLWMFVPMLVLMLFSISW